MSNNTRDTIIVVATFAYTTAVNPPGGIYQDGPLIGTAVAARKTAFKVFLVCNNLALFTSIGIVLGSISLIPLNRSSMMLKLRIAQGAIWFAILFLIGAYVAAQMVIVQPPSRRRRGMDWTIEFCLIVSAGSLGTMLVGLVIYGVKLTLRRRWTIRQRVLQQEIKEQVKEGRD